MITVARSPQGTPLINNLVNVSRNIQTLQEIYSTDRRLTCSNLLLNNHINIKSAPGSRCGISAPGHQRTKLLKIENSASLLEVPI